MLCKICGLDTKQSCSAFHHTEITHLLCLSKHIPIDIVRVLASFLFHYKGHILSYVSLPQRRICTSCFHLGYYKMLKSGQTITRYNFMNFFNTCVDDRLKEKLLSYFTSAFLPACFIHKICNTPVSSM